jgi:hypothetical protein
MAYANPHPHRGKLRPFALREPGVILNESVLKQGLPHFTTTSLEEGGRPMLVQDIHAPVDVVWDCILDFNSYAAMVPNTVESTIYKRENMSHHDSSAAKERILVRLKMGVPMLNKKLDFHVDHVHDAPRKIVTWTLDYDQMSDIDDSVGIWHAIPHPDRPQDWSRVYYSVEMRMFPWVPKFVLTKFIKQEKVLLDAMTWVETASIAKVGTSNKDSSKGMKQPSSGSKSLSREEQMLVSSSPCESLLLCKTEVCNVGP